jgi:protein-L-isoaspartate(D-aspartate) O-methyltransferase
MMAEAFTVQRARMVERQLRARGIRCEAVLAAMGEVPREMFVPADQQHLAYRDQAVPLSRGQTISQPYMVAVMTEALQLRPEDRVLEIGTGSGYQTAVLCQLAAAVFTVERIPSLAQTAQEILLKLGCTNTRFLVGDGTLGWPDEAPFDAILVTAGAPGAPTPLKSQLAEEGGRLVVPVGDRFVQELVRITRRGDSFDWQDLLSCRFVPLLGAEGWEEPGIA